LFENNIRDIPSDFEFTIEEGDIADYASDVIVLKYA